MEIFDSQIHCWDGTKPGIDPHRGDRMTDADLLPRMDAAGVTRAVLVPGFWGADNNQAALNAARRHPDRFTVMGHLEVGDPALPAGLADIAGQPGMSGIRLALRMEPYASYLGNGALDWLWAAAEELRLQLMVYAPAHTEVIAEIARHHPDLRLIIDHLGIDPAEDETTRLQQLEQSLAIASAPNVAVKLSALPLYSREDYPHHDVLTYVRPLLGAFGADRCFWGSDMTRVAPYPYEQAVSMITDEAGLDQSTLELVMGRALTAWLGWP